VVGQTVRAHQGKSPAIYWQISNWHPKLVGKNLADILNAPFQYEDALWTIAREHGFKNWHDAQTRGNIHPVIDFEHAVEAVISGDDTRLHEVLQNNAHLARATSTFGHRATLLHYVAANGVETRRQKIPSNAANIVRTLIAAGADPKAPMHVYNGTFDTLSLLTSSAHAKSPDMIKDIATILQAPPPHQKPSRHY